MGERLNARLGRIARRGRERVSGIGATSLRAKRSNLSRHIKNGLLRFARNDVAGCFENRSYVTLDLAPQNAPVMPGLDPDIHQSS